MATAQGHRFRLLQIPHSNRSVISWGFIVTEQKKGKELSVTLEEMPDRQSVEKQGDLCCRPQKLLPGIGLGRGE